MEKKVTITVEKLTLLASIKVPFGTIIEQERDTLSYYLRVGVISQLLGLINTKAIINKLIEELGLDSTGTANTVRLPAPIAEILHKKRLNYTEVEFWVMAKEEHPVEDALQGIAKITELF